MGYLYAKIKNRGSRIRKILHTDYIIFPSANDSVQESVPYDPQTILEEGVWYTLKDFSTTDYALSFLTEDINSAAYNQLTDAEFMQLEFIFSVSSDRNEIYFQKVGRAALTPKKSFIGFNNGFQYEPNSKFVAIKQYPDAIYKKKEDILLFRDLSSITSIFNGISELYREATKEEIQQFLDMEFVVADGVAAESVTIPNRKRIALAMKTLNQLNQTETQEIHEYITEYCPKLKGSENKFKVTNNEELSLLLYGIEQRFYTTRVGQEKRIANSIRKL